MLLERTLKKIRVVPLAAESFGVRSMCTYIETPDVRLLLDAGVSLAPNRFGFSPHPKEYEALAECRRRISEAAEKAEVVTLSHYHFDHHTPSFEDWCYNFSSAEVAKQIYGEKIVLVKSHKDMINFSQRRRGWMFRKTGGKSAKQLEIADGKEFKFESTTVQFSGPVFHGTQNSELGWVLMTTIICGDEKVLFASDVQGPMCDPTLEKILSEAPNLIIIGGPPAYLAGFAVAEEDIQRGLRNLKAIVEKVPVTILEHHILRGENWKNLSQPVFDVAKTTNHIIVTAAEFLGKGNNLLESQRKQLFEAHPLSPEFAKWAKLPQPKRKLVKPPV